MRAVLLFILSYLALSCDSISTTSYFTEADRNHAKRVLLEALALKEVQTIHFGTLGLKLLGEKIQNSGDLCNVLMIAANRPKQSAESLYFVASSHKAIGNCAQPLPVMNIVKNLNAILTDETSNMQDIYYAVNALISLGQKPQDITKLVKAIQAILKKNDSLANLGYLFHISSHLGADGAFALDRIEDAIVQADEVDSKYLQYEGGLSITALIINGIYKLSSNLNKQPPITHEQAVKFASYFLSRKSVQTPKGVWSLLEALQTFSTNKFHIPASVTLASSPSVSAESPKINVRISNVLGKGIGLLSVIADSATRVSDEVVVLSKKKFEPTSDNTIYVLNLLEAKPEKGMYKITISAKLDKPDPRVVSNIGSTVNIKVMCVAGIDFVDIGTADADQTTQPKFERLDDITGVSWLAGKCRALGQCILPAAMACEANPIIRIVKIKVILDLQISDKVDFPNKLSKQLEADTQQKIVMRFSVKDKLANKLISVHQAFVRFYKTKEDVSVIFVAEPDNTLQYKFDLDVGAKAEDFNHISGLYDVELIIGDSVLSNSFAWKLGSIKLTFTSKPKTENVLKLYNPKPEIKHLFREPEKRPPKIVSNLFSALVCAPLFLLIFLWIKLRINVSNFQFSLSSIGFHLGLGALFGLFYLFWRQLNMFQTMRYLAVIGFCTFLCGNKLLRKVAQKKK